MAVSPLNLSLLFSSQRMAAEKGMTVPSMLDALQKGGAGDPDSAFSLLKGMNRKEGQGADVFRGAPEGGAGRDPFGSSSQVQLSDEALKALFGDQWQAMAELFGKKGQETKKTEGGAQDDALKNGDSKAAAKAFIDKFFAGATSEEALQAKEGLEKLIEGMEDVSVDQGLQGALEKAVRQGKASPNVLFLSGSNGTLLRLEFSDSPKGKKLQASYHSVSEGSLDVVMRRYEGPRAGTRLENPMGEKISVETETRKADASGRVSRLPGKKSRTEGDF